MFTIKGTLLFGLALALADAPVAAAQGKSGGKGHGGGGGNPHTQAAAAPRGNGPNAQEKSAKNRGRSKEIRTTRNATSGNSITRRSSGNPGKGRGSQFVHAASVSRMPVSMRHYVTSDHARDVIAAGAVAHAYARGNGRNFRIDDTGDRVRIVNPRGDALVDLDDESADNLGRWRVGVVNDEVRDGSPSFCRSGEGHPVWGRQWCLDKGFGLGAYNDYRWGRTSDVGDIVFPRTGIAGTLGTLALSNLLGPTTFNRLALHAVTLGLLEPLTGRWVSQLTGPQMLYVNSGSAPVAELVDNNRDFRIEDLLVSLLPW